MPSARNSFGRVCQIAEHCHRLFKGSHQIFAAGQVDRSLSAYGRIHLCQQAGGDLEIVQTAEIGRRRESGNISYHAAAKCNNHTFSVHFVFDTRTAYSEYCIHTLVFFTCRKCVYF